MRYSLPVKRVLPLAFLGLLAAFVACVPGGGPALLDPSEGGVDLDFGNDAGVFTKSDVDLGDPFALDGIQPSHGPFTGGTNARLGGRGFTSRLRVFIGDVQVPAGNVLAGDPTRATIVTPPGAPGYVDVRIHDDATAMERILPKGFLYDAFVVQPDVGATSGGTRIAIVGSGSAWTTSDVVTIGGVPCSSPTLLSPTRIECITPPGTAGAKDVAVIGPSGGAAREAFTYGDSPDGNRGGLAGGALSGTIRVLAYDSYLGIPLPGATVILGGKLPGGTVGTTTASGVVELGGLTSSKITVTVTAKCHQPITFVDVPVDTVTAYLDPVLDPSCIPDLQLQCLTDPGQSCPFGLDPPSTGGSGGRFGGVVEGELTFPGGAEFQRAGWSTVPAPNKPTERLAAYVMTAKSSPNQDFTLPPADQAITPETTGASGYAYSVLVRPGNATLYVVAGIEDRSEVPPTFTPYAMGIARGISVPTQTRVTGVDIKMDILFDHQVTLAPTPPVQGPRGPDRYRGRIAMTLGSTGFALLPGAVRTLSLPVPNAVPFVGVPSLDHAAAGEQYVIGSVAATGATLQAPASVIGRIRTTNANEPIALGGFLGVPILGTPGAALWPGDHVLFTGGEGPADLTYITVASGNGLSTWTIVAPGRATDFDVPDLHLLAVPGPVTLPAGTITTTTWVARIDDFQYGRLRYGQLSTTAWSAYAFDSQTGLY